MANDDKKPVWISSEAHENLKEYCDQTGRTQVDVVSELLYKFIEPKLKEKKEEKED